MRITRRSFVATVTAVLTGGLAMASKGLSRPSVRRLASVDRDRLRNHQWKVEHSEGMVRFGIKGQSDITGILRPSGRFLAIEVKTAAGRQSKEQKRYQAMVEKYGGIYVLARSVEDVEAGL